MRKSISVAFFSMMSTLLVAGIVLMGCSEWVLFKSYFAKGRYETLDQVVGVAERTAQYLVQKAALPEGEELEMLNTKLEIIGESAEAYLFFTDNDGNVMLASNPDMLNDGAVDIDFRTSANAAADPDGGERYHLFSDLEGTLTEKSYIAVVQLVDSRSYPSGWLFLCSSGEQLKEFKQQFWSNFLLSACIMLLCASILTQMLMRRLTDPLQKVTAAAPRIGGGDLLSLRLSVEILPPPHRHLLHRLRHAASPQRGLRHAPHHRPHRAAGRPRLRLRFPAQLQPQLRKMDEAAAQRIQKPDAVASGFRFIFCSPMRG